MIAIAQPFQLSFPLTVLNVLPSLEPIVFITAAIVMIIAPAITAYSKAVTPLSEVWICLIKAKRSLRDNVLPSSLLICGRFKSARDYVT